MSHDKKLDFHYAVSNTEIPVSPKGILETFGNTILNYVLISESMDSVNECHVRTGRMKLLKPQIITPSAYSQMLLEGFGEEAQKYIKWLTEHEKDVHILRYGYTLKRESFSETTLHRPLQEVLDQAIKDVTSKNDPYLALVKGVDDPWDVCLVRLFWEVVRQSIPKNIMDLSKQHIFEHRNAVLSTDDRQEIEAAFVATAKNPTSSMIRELGALLQKHHVFEAYEDRFFALMERSKTLKR